PTGSWASCTRPPTGGCGSSRWGGSASCATSPTCSGQVSTAPRCRGRQPPSPDRRHYARMARRPRRPPVIRPSGPHQFPQLDSPAEQRTPVKRRMAAAVRLFDRFGFNEGVAGHLTARDPERTDPFWVTPFGLSFGLIRASDLILVNHDGDVVEGDWPVN